MQFHISTGDRYR